ncbi:hypothetical protein D3C76_615910 [compost metagenome]
MIEDITTVIKAQLYDRITSPLTGAFLFSWPIWNWKFLLILLSDLKAPEKLSFISETIFNDTHQIILNGILFPLASAAALVIIYPFPSRLFFWIAQYHKKSMKLIQQRSEDEMPMTNEQVARILNNATESQLQWQKESRELTATISELKDKLGHSEQLLTSISDRSKSIESESQGLLSKISSIEKENKELATNINHLQAIISSTSYAAFLNPNEKEPNYSGLRKIKSIISTDNQYRPDKDLGIENAIRRGMDKNGLLLNSSPEIYAISGNIYLRVSKPTPEIYIIGEYSNEDNNRASIENSLELLKAFDEHGFRT